MAWFWLGKCLHVGGMKDIYFISAVKVSFLENINPFIPCGSHTSPISELKSLNIVSIMVACLTKDMLSYYIVLSYLEIEFFNKFVLFAILMLLRDTMTKVTCKKKDLIGSLQLQRGLNWEIIVTEKFRIWGHYGRHHGSKQTGMILRIYLWSTNMRQRESKLIGTMGSF